MEPDNRMKRLVRRSAAAGFAGIALASIGCAPRALTIETDEYINTARHVDRAPTDRQGDPLSVDIVCVFSADLERPENSELRMEGGRPKINSQTWYDRRPTGNVEADKSSGKFSIPVAQIYVLSDAPELRKAGTAKDGFVRGAAHRGYAKSFKVPGIDFGSFGNLHDKQAVIYVFGRFTDKNGAVLPVAPALFDPPGAYDKDLRIKIGVDPDEFAKGPPLYGQYIKNTTERSRFWHSKSE